VDICSEVIKGGLGFDYCVGSIHKLVMLSHSTLVEQSSLIISHNKRFGQKLDREITLKSQEKCSEF